MENLKEEIYISNFTFASLTEGQEILKCIPDNSGNGAGASSGGVCVHASGERNSGRQDLSLK